MPFGKIKPGLRSRFPFLGDLTQRLHLRLIRLNVAASFGRFGEEITFCLRDGVE